MVADIEKKIRNVQRKTHSEGRKISLQKGEMIGKQFEEKVIELVDVAIPNLQNFFKDMLNTVYYVHGRKRRYIVKKALSGKMHTRQIARIVLRRIRMIMEA